MDITRISQSLLKAFFNKGITRNYCARKIHHRYFLKEKVEETTESMLKGIYFERLTLGGDPIELPTKLNGDLKVDTIRINQQIESFFQLMKGHLMMLYPLVNTQIKLKKRYSFEIILEGIIDWFPTFFFTDDTMQLCVIDLKLTKDLNNTFGDFCWGKPETMDLIQAAFYCHLIQDIDWELNMHLSPATKALIQQYQRDISDGNFKFYFLVFDYKEPPEYRLIEIPNDENLRQFLQQSIERVMEEIAWCSSLGWQANPTTENCKRCILPCTERFDVLNQQNQVVKLLINAT
jgi:hypothetical protein